MNRPICIVGGIGDGTGTGGGVAKIFSRAGYAVALVARGSSGTVGDFAKKLNAENGDAHGFPVEAYTKEEIRRVYDEIKKRWPNSPLRVAVMNFGTPNFKPFMAVTDEEVEAEAQVNVLISYIFTREALVWMKDQPLDENGKRGTFIFTGAGPGTRGSAVTAGFSPGKWAVRAFANCLAHEFGNHNIHIAHCILDSPVAMNYHFQLHDEAWGKDPDNKLQPESIGKAYLFLAQQDRSAWTFELDLRSAHDNWNIESTLA